MAQRRMFSLKVVDADAFLDMGQGAQLLYFHLSMRADDDGFVGNPKKIMRMIGSSEDDLKVLFAKRFLLPFETGIVVIKHWRMHNYIKNDRYQETQYLEEKSRLQVKDNGSYTECIQNGTKMDTQVRLGKVRLGKVRKDNTTEANASEVNEVINTFKEVNPSYGRLFAQKTQRAACERLLKLHGLDKLQKVIRVLPHSNTQQFMPVVTTPLQLESKWGQLAAAFQKAKSNEPQYL